MDTSIESIGIIIPHNWTAQNVVSEILICFPGELEYLVEENECGTELLEYVRHIGWIKVNVNGTIKTDSLKGQIMPINHYQVVK